MISWIVFINPHIPDAEILVNDETIIWEEKPIKKFYFILLPTPKVAWKVDATADWVELATIDIFHTDGCPLHE